MIGQQFSTKRVIMRAGIAIVAVVAFIVLTDKVIMPYYTRHGQALVVPNVVAKRFEVAKEQLELQGLQVIQAGGKHNARLPFGYVAEQNPRPGVLVKEGRRVYLVISVGEKELQTPKLTGLSETNAIQQLKSQGLRLGDVEYVYVPNEPPNIVIDQSPAPESMVKLSDVIDIVVSLGRPTDRILVPSLLGKPLNMGKREIQKAGLILGEIKYQIGRELLPNTIIDQSLDPGLEVVHGDTISLLVTTEVQNER